MLGDVRPVGLLLRIKDILDLGEAVHKGCNLIPKFRPEVLHGIIRVFHYVVEECGRYGLVSKADIVYNNLRHGDRVEHIRLTAAPSDVTMGVVCKLEGLLHHRQLTLVGASFLCRCPQELVVTPDPVVIFLCKL